MIDKWFAHKKLSDKLPA